MRIRTIKPEFWKSKDIKNLPFEFRLLFIGLWSYVDDNGVGEDDEYLIAADLFPREEDQNAVRKYIRDGLATLSRGLQVVRYQVDGKPLLFITAWDKHQKIDKPAKPRHPRPETIPTRPNDPDDTSPKPDSRDSREGVAPGTEEQGNRGTGSSSPTPQGDSPRATARETLATLNDTAITHNTLRAVTDWNTTRGHNHTRTDLHNLAHALDALAADGANPQLFQTTLDIQHAEGRTLAFLPHAYRQATKTAGHSGASSDVHVRGGAPAPSGRGAKVQGWLELGRVRAEDVHLPPNDGDPAFLLIEGGRSA